MGIKKLLICLGIVKEKKIEYFLGEFGDTIREDPYKAVLEFGEDKNPPPYITNLCWRPAGPKPEYNTVERFLEKMKVEEKSPKGEVLSDENAELMWCVEDSWFEQLPFKIKTKERPGSKVVEVFFDHVKLFSLRFIPDWVDTPYSLHNSMYMEKVWSWKVIRIQQDRDYVEIFFKHVKDQFNGVLSIKDAEYAEQQKLIREQQMEYLIKNFPKEI